MLCFTPRAACQHSWNQRSRVDRASARLRRHPLRTSEQVRPKVGRARFQNATTRCHFRVMQQAHQA